MPINNAKIMNIVERMTQISPAKTENCFRANQPQYNVGLPLQSIKFSESLTLTIVPLEQLTNMLPMFDPQMRTFVSSMINDESIYRRVFTGRYETILLYAYVSLVIATQHINYILYEDRLDTFRQSELVWPFTGHLSPEKMATWGFFRREPYEKQQTTCFSCGCVLSDWIVSDAALDGHAQFRPQCSFMWLMLVLHKAMYDDASNSLCSVREIQSINTHIRIPGDRIEERLQKLVTYNDMANHTVSQLLAAERQSYVLARYICHHSHMDLVFTICKKLFRYWNTQKTAATERDLVVDIKHLFPTGVNLVKDSLQNRRNATNLKYIPGGMPPNSEFVKPPNNGMSELIQYIKDRYTPVTISFQPSSEPISTTSVTTSSTSSSVERALASRICVRCMRESAIYLCLPCRHLALCARCGDAPLSILHCPACSNILMDIIRVYNS